MTLVDGIYRPAGPNGLPLLVPPGCEADGYRELLVHERDTNWISQYTQFLMFMGMANTELQFYDGNDYYSYYYYLYNSMLLASGFYLCPTTVTIPSGEVSNITLPADSAIFTGTGSDYIIPGSTGFTVSTYSVTYGQTSVSLTTSLTAGSASFNVAQVGFLPADSSGTNEIKLLAGGTSPYVFTNPTAYSSVPTTPVAVYTSYQLSQVYTVPADGAITIEYGITATL